MMVPAQSVTVVFVSSSGDRAALDTDLNLSPTLEAANANISYAATV